jgi:hypothetical protein
LSCKNFTGRLLHIHPIELACEAFAVVEKPLQGLASRGRKIKEVQKKKKRKKRSYTVTEKSICCLIDKKCVVGFVSELLSKGTFSSKEGIQTRGALEEGGEGYVQCS